MNSKFRARKEREKVPTICSGFYQTAPALTRRPSPATRLAYIFFLPRTLRSRPQFDSRRSSSESSPRIVHRQKRQPSSRDRPAQVKFRARSALQHLFCHPRPRRGQASYVPSVCSVSCALRWEVPPRWLSVPVAGSLEVISHFHPHSAFGPGAIADVTSSRQPIIPVSSRPSHSISLPSPVPGHPGIPSIPGTWALGHPAVHGQFFHRRSRPSRFSPGLGCSRPSPGSRPRSESRPKSGSDPERWPGFLPQSHQSRLGTEPGLCPWLR